MATTLTSTDPTLQGIIEKVNHGERLTLEDGLTLYHSPDLLTIGQLANQVNRQKNDDCLLHPDPYENYKTYNVLHIRSYDRSSYFQ